MKKVNYPRSWRFGSIPMEVFESDISTHAKLLLGAIMSHAFGDGPSWPGQDRLSKLCSCSINQVAKATKELVNYGFLSIEIRPGKSSIYQFLSKSNPPTTCGGFSDTPPPRISNPPTTWGTTPPPRGDEIDEVNETNERHKDCPPSEVLPKQVADHQKFIKLWVEKWESVNGKKYPFTAGKDGTAVRDLLKLYGFDTLKQLSDASFSAKQEWWHKSGTASIAGLRSMISHVIQYQAKNKKIDALDMSKSLRVAPDWGKI